MSQQTEPQTTQMTQPQQKKKREKKMNLIANIYSKCLIHRVVLLPMTSIGNNILETIENNIKKNYEGKCIVEGFVRLQSSKVITYSSGIISGSNIQFDVAFECEVCCPVEGMSVRCIATNITQAGIRAESADEKPSPIVVFIARDHNYMSKYFSTIKEKDVFIANIIGQRYELNDKYVSIIASLNTDKININEVNT